MLWNRLISVYEIVIRNFFHFEKLEIFHFKAWLFEENLTLEADPFSEYRTRPSDVLASAFIQPGAAPATDIARRNTETHTLYCTKVQS